MLRCHWQSVESPLTGGGTPDANYCADGREGWVEFKKTTSWSVGLDPDQVGWLTRRSRAGGRVFVAVRRVAAEGPRRGDSADELWLLRGSFAREIKVSGLRGVPSRALLGCWPGGPARWPWARIRDLLRS